MTLMAERVGVNELMERARLPVHFLEARQTQLHVVLDEVPLPEVNRVRPVPVQ